MSTQNNNHNHSSSHHNHRNLNSDHHSCSKCGKPAKFMCSLCNDNAHYCSLECQTADWPSHKLSCPGASQYVQRIRDEQRHNTTGRDASHSAAVHALGNTRDGHHEHTPQQNQTRSRWNMAQWINSKFRRDNVELNGQSQPDEPAPTEEETLEDLKYYMHQIYLIIKPVMMCIILSILWVKVTQSTDEYYRTDGTPSFDYVSGALGVQEAGGVENSLIVAGIILAQIVVATVVIMLLFKYGCFKILYGIFFVIVLALLGLFGYLLILELIVKANAAFDQITFYFCLWNMAATGLVILFYKAPMILQQSYLVAMSSLMAYSLNSRLPGLTAWIVLALLAIWDLIAVLCPFGPLRMLLESSQQQNRNIPVLLYTAMAEPAKDHELPSTRIRQQQQQQEDYNTGPHYASSSPQQTVRYGGQPYGGGGGGQGYGVGFGDAGGGGQVYAVEDERAELTIVQRQASVETLVQQPAQQQRAGDPQGQQPQEEEEEEEGGLKLGLGDFVFYSVLISKAAFSDWITTASCTIAVMTGLNMTIFLLAIWHKALPALPISIAFGLLFYFVASITLMPMTTMMLNLPTAPAGSGSAGGGVKGLTVGTLGGGGMVYI
ncbi:Presenilin-domain-containing protein [Cladochytrium replicatum]|nr:Presenilin-domain-containing protein [Cladochytrium replicatum]